MAGTDSLIHVASAFNSLRLSRPPWAVGVLLWARKRTNAFLYVC